MLFAYWVLVVLYALLFFLYTFTHPAYGSGAAVQPWPRVPDVLPDYEWAPAHISNLPCDRHDACPTDHLCLAKHCVPKYVKGGSCDPQRYGEWQSYDYNGARFAICVCLRPELFKQKHFGGDCELSVACGAHGTHNLMTDACDCEYGYAPGPRLTCVQLPASQLHPCGEQELRVDASLSAELHPQYLDRLLASRVKCVKRPCQFDPWSGRPLSKKAHFAPGWGCVCDPRYGLVGIRLEKVQYLHNDDEGLGDNACMSIYKEPLQYPRNDVEMYQYFYLMRRAPITLIRFPNVWKDDLVRVFREQMESGGTTLTVSADWPRNFMQHVLKHERFDARTRQCHEGFFGYAICNEHAIETDYEAPPCIDLHTRTLVEYSRDIKTSIYKQMYRFPVCDMATKNKYVDPKLKGTRLLNPYHLIYDKHDYVRTNGLQMTYRPEAQKWFLDEAPPYELELYRSIHQQTNVPQIVIGKPQVERTYSGRVL